MYSWRWESALIRLLCHYRWDYGQEYRLCIESVRALWNRFPLLPVTDDSLLKYKSICQHPNHVVILIKTTGVLSSLLKHCLRVFFRRDTGIVFLARLKPAEPMRLAQPELMIMWGCKDSLSLSLFLPFSNSTISSSCICELLRVDAYPKGKLEKMHVVFVSAIRDCQKGVLWDHAAGKSHDRVG